jgi:predicted RNA polymerase sigma factor
MRRKFVDTTVFEARNMAKDGNIDFAYWHDKTIEERLGAAAQMIAVAFNEPLFTTKKIDRTLYSARKRSL